MNVRAHQVCCLVAVARTDRVEDLAAGLQHTSGPRRLRVLHEHVPHQLAQRAEGGLDGPVVCGAGDRVMKTE